MAEKNPVNQARIDEEWAKLQAKEFPRRRIKCLGIIIAVVSSHLVILMVLALTVFRFKDPDIKLNSVSIEQMNIAPGASPTFNMTLNAEILVKNRNWGEFKFENSTATVSYRGITVGEVQIPKGRAKMRRTRPMFVVVEVTSDRVDINSGILRMSSYTKLSGKSEALEMFKQYKAEVEKQLDRPIKAVRSDRGGEYYGKANVDGVNHARPLSPVVQVTRTVAVPVQEEQQGATIAADIIAPTQTVVAPTVAAPVSLRRSSRDRRSAMSSDYEVYLNEEKDQVYPLAPSSKRPRSDEESATMAQSKELRRKRNIECYAHIAVGVVLLTIIILVFALTVMRIKTPDVKLRSVTVENLNVGTTASPSFNMTLIAEVSVKNKNFGHFKFENSTATVSYRGMTVGEAYIAKGRAKARKTRRMNVTIDVNSDRLTGVSNLSSDINSGILTLRSQAKLSGKVHLMEMIKKRKTAEMSCTMTISLISPGILDLICE
ncbi:hypothetical protein HHK36_029056 [Tetracentron sinense]|uniref:Late embryogenesis abundant protein LEA-2 subgroup domain-containing protein n=1 Tax=Tetracentron sinense TaxID=13715 RepID=A0A835D190_TETSI|nr:hypothetical protein HHK36_029056 [Tetracentron sinense]